MMISCSSSLRKNIGSGDAGNSSISQIKTNLTCSEFDEKSDFQTRYNVTLGCIKNGKLQRSYFLLKGMLSGATRPSDRSKILNNLGYIQTKLGHFSSGRLLFEESMNVMKNETALYNLLLSYIDSGYRNLPQSLVQDFLENSNHNGDVQVSELKARISFLKERSASMHEFYKTSGNDKETLANFEYAKKLLPLEVNSRSEETVQIPVKATEVIEGHELDGEEDFE